MESVSIDMNELSKKIADAIAADSKACISVTTDIASQQAVITIDRTGVLKVIREVMDNFQNYYIVGSGWLFYYIDPDSATYVNPPKFNPKYIYSGTEKCAKKICKYEANSGPFSDSPFQYYTVFVHNMSRNVNDREKARKTADGQFIKAKFEGKLPKRFTPGDDQN